MAILRLFGNTKNSIVLVIKFFDEKSQGISVEEAQEIIDKRNNEVLTSKWFKEYDEEVITFK